MESKIIKRFFICFLLLSSCQSISYFLKEAKKTVKEEQVIIDNAENTVDEINSIK